MCLKTMINDGGLAKVLEVADRVSSDLFALNNPHQSSSGRRSNGHGKRQRFAKVGSADVGPSSPTCTDDNASCQCGKPHHSNERKCEELEATRCQEVSAPSAAPGEEAASGSDTKAPFEKSSSGMRRKPSRTLSELNSFNSEGQLSCLPVSNESDGNEELQSRELHEDHPPNAQPQHIMTKDASSLSSSSSSSSLMASFRSSASFFRSPR
mmetsp:Transcript_26603/g.54844  ORF Transcript_26603/g.54844 Transcript_26603/m.54844 type:complete len:210 (-) Transcript_26603:2520-3149(-)